MDLTSVNKDKDIFNASLNIKSIIPLTCQQFVQIYQHGMVSCEVGDFVSAISAGYREVIAVTPDIPRSVAKMVRAKDFTFTTNQMFGDVARECFSIRLDDGIDRRWGRERTLDVLGALRCQGVAHSIEIYQDEVLVGGIVGLGIKGLFVGLSVFSACDGAGKAAFVVMKTTLAGQGYRIIDAIMPSAISRQFGGIMITKNEYTPIRLTALAVRASFPKVRTPRAVLGLL